MTVPLSMRRRIRPWVGTATEQDRANDVPVPSRGRGLAGPNREDGGAVPRPHAAVHNGVGREEAEGKAVLFGISKPRSLLSGCCFLLLQPVRCGYQEKGQ